MKKSLALFSILLVSACVSVPRSNKTYKTNKEEVSKDTIGLLRPFSTVDTFKFNDGGVDLYRGSNGIQLSPYAPLDLYGTRRNTIYIHDTVYIKEAFYDSTDKISTFTDKGGNTFQYTRKTGEFAGTWKLLAAGKEWSKYASQVGLLPKSDTTGLGIVTYGTVDALAKNKRIEVIHDSVFMYKDSSIASKALFSQYDSLKISAKGYADRLSKVSKLSRDYLIWAMIATLASLVLLGAGLIHHKKE